MAFSEALYTDQLEFRFLHIKEESLWLRHMAE
jgi:hypothetical protein